MIETHADLTGQLKPFVLLFTVFALAYVGVDWWQARQQDDNAKKLRWLTWTLDGAAVVIGLFAVVWVARTGHSGADAVWHDTKVVKIEREDR